MSATQQGLTKLCDVLISSKVEQNGGGTSKVEQNGGGTVDSTVGVFCSYSTPA